MTLKGSGATPITDIAGNPLAGNGTTAGTDFSLAIHLERRRPNLIYVNAAATRDRPDPADGTIENPYPTIMAAMAVAVPGDIVAVLPGVYTENVVLKPFVKLESAASTSTDTNLVPGNALDTVIRAPEPAPATTTPTTPTTPALNVTVLAQNLPYIPGADNVVSGFTISSPLTGTLDTPRTRPRVRSTRTRLPSRSRTPTSCSRTTTSPTPTSASTSWRPRGPS